MEETACPAGSVSDMLYGASLMPNLKVLDASDQALSGQLSPVSVPSLEVLNLSNNSIQVRHARHRLWDAQNQSSSCTAIAPEAELP